jgi:methylglutaconyl-CoA hydratase
MADTLVRSDTTGGVATVTMDSPHNRNALSSALIDGMLDALAAAVADDAVRVIVLTHTGTVFCSGADLKETAAALGGGTGIPAGRMGELLAAVWESPKPVVARVGGAARAGGLGLVAAADVAVCSMEATFAFTEVRLGVIPAVISATVLPRLAPRAAAELFLTGDTFDGARAAQVGLVTSAVPPEELDAAVARYVRSLVLGAPAALAATKRLLRPAEESIAEQLTELSALSVGFFGSAEGREGMAAFAQRRAPAWVPTP